MKPLPPVPKAAVSPWSKGVFSKVNRPSPTEVIKWALHYLQFHEFMEIVYVEGNLVGDTDRYCQTIRNAWSRQRSKCIAALRRGGHQHSIGMAVSTRTSSQYKGTKIITIRKILK